MRNRDHKKGQQSDSAAKDAHKELIRRYEALENDISEMRKENRPYVDEWLRQLVTVDKRLCELIDSPRERPVSVHMPNQGFLSPRHAP